MAENLTKKQARDKIHRLNYRKKYPDRVKESQKKWHLKQNKTLKGKLRTIYLGHFSKRTKNVNIKVIYSYREFIDRYINDKKYIRLYNEWVKSGYKREKSPSIDRINPLKNYSFDNTNLMTWGENLFKSYTIDRKFIKKYKI